MVKRFLSDGSVQLIELDEIKSLLPESLFDVDLIGDRKPKSVIVWITNEDSIPEKYEIPFEYL